MTEFRLSLQTRFDLDSKRLQVVFEGVVTLIIFIELIRRCNEFKKILIDN
mgnify:CR=1 FL=1